MTSFSSDFSSSSSYVDSGLFLGSDFSAVWPPEAGCIGFSVSGIGSVGPVVAKVTDIAREYMARSVVDGTAYKVGTFAVGSSGYDVSNPLLSTAVDPGAVSLTTEVYRDTIDLVETANLSGTAKAFVCRLSRDDLAAGIGEIALFAEILNSPFSSEIGTFFMFAIAHQPLNVKTYNHVSSYRVIITLSG